MSFDKPLLEVSGVTKRFGGLVAVNDVSFSIRKGDLLGVIGPNGAGKTTLFNIISGELRPTEGSVHLKGEDITRLSPHVICQHGLSRTFQLTRIFPDLTVYESVWVGANSKAGRPWKPFASAKSDRATHEKTIEICEMVGIANRLYDPAVNLSYGDQKVLEIAMALSTEPSLLLLDEPTQGVSPQESDEIATVVEKLSQTITIVLIEHTIEIVLRLCNVLAVLSEGGLLAMGPPEEIRSNAEVQRIYLGEVD